MKKEIPNKVSEAVRRQYKITPIVINNLSISQVIIDPHYEIKHSDTINDFLILKLVTKLNGRLELPVMKKDGYSYFATVIDLDNKNYRLIWLLKEKALFIGIINVFRDKRKVKNVVSSRS